MTVENNNRNPVIVINVLAGSKGHQIGRLIASCTNILWYDYVGNGTHPWEACGDILNGELSQYHFDRRFADKSWIPPVLSRAKKMGLPETPTIPYDKCENGQNLLYVIHDNLDESRNYFNAQHVVVLNKDPERFFETSWNFVGRNDEDHQTMDTVSKIYTKEEVRTFLTNTLINYQTNINSDDFVIYTIDDLFDMDNFKLLCEKFDLIFNEDHYKKVVEFLKK